MKLKKIISLIEFLNFREINQLISYLNEEIDLNQFPPDIQKAIEEGNGNLIAKKIILKEIKETKDLLLFKGNDGEEVVFKVIDFSNKFNLEWYTKDLDLLKFTGSNSGKPLVFYLIKILKEKDRKFLMNKEVLMIQNKNGWSVAHELADTNSFYKKEIDSLDKEVLSLKNEFGTSVAHILAKKHRTWTTDDPEILKLKDRNDFSVAHKLAYLSGEKKWVTKDKEILKMQDKNGDSVAHFLTYFCDISGWFTRDPEILKIKNNKGDSVAHLLAEYHPTWTTDNPDILNLKNKRGISVKDILIEKGRIR